MYKIWFCEYEGELEKDNCNISLSYNKVLYEDIAKEDLSDYLDYICGDLKCTRSTIFGGRYVKLFDLKGFRKNYCLFLEEELEG